MLTALEIFTDVNKITAVKMLTAVTAVTVQNTRGVKSVVSIPANEIYNQIIYL